MQNNLKTIAQALEKLIIDVAKENGKDPDVVFVKPNIEENCLEFLTEEQDDSINMEYKEIVIFATEEF